VYSNHIFPGSSLVNEILPGTRILQPISRFDVNIPVRYVLGKMGFSRD